MNPEEQCPEFERVRKWLEKHHLPPQEVEAIRSHVKGCKLCQILKEANDKGWQDGIDVSRPARRLEEAQRRVLGEQQAAVGEVPTSVGPPPGGQESLDYLDPPDADRPGFI